MTAGSRQVCYKYRHGYVLDPHCITVGDKKDDKGKKGAGSKSSASGKTSGRKTADTKKSSGKSAPLRKVDVSDKIDRAPGTRGKHRKPDRSSAKGKPGSLESALKEAKDSDSSRFIKRHEDGSVTVHETAPDGAHYRVSPGGSLLRVKEDGSTKPVADKNRQTVERLLSGKQSARDAELERGESGGNEPPRTTDAYLPASQREQVDRGKAAIAKVHSTEGMPDIPLDDASSSYSDAGGPPDGYFLPPFAPDAVGFIALSPDSRSSGNTFIHEFGHAIDYMGLGSDRSKSSVQNPEHTVVGASLVQFERAGARSKAVQKAIANSTPKYAEYISDPREVWARAYAQFIAEASRDEVLMKEVARMQQRAAPANAIPFVWSGDDWPPMRDAVRRVLVTKGWMQ